MIRGFLISIIAVGLAACGNSGDYGSSVTVLESNSWVPSPGSFLTTDVTTQGSLKVLPENDPSNLTITADRIYAIAARVTSYQNNNRVPVNALGHFWSASEDIFLVIFSDQPIVCGAELGKKIPFSQGVLVAQYFNFSEFSGGRRDSSWKNGWMYSYRIGEVEKVHTPYSTNRFISLDANNGTSVTVTADINGADGSGSNSHVELKGTFDISICP